MPSRRPADALSSQASGRSARKRVRKAHRPPPGSPPGTLAAQPDAVPTAFRLFFIGGSDGGETSGVTAAEAVQAISSARDGGKPVWIDVVGLAEVEALRGFGEGLALHGLALADAVHAHQRPKQEPYEDHLFIVTRTPCGSGTDTAQISLLVGEHFVVTLAERESPALEAVRQRLRNPASRLRQQGADYLAYALLDAALDEYFPLLEELGGEVEDLEELVATGAAESQLLQRLHVLRRNLVGCRRAIWPQRDLFAQLLRDETPFIRPETRLYLRDCYDHSVQLMDLLESYRELAASLHDLQLSQNAARSNEIMKVLTVIATIFIPLGWIAGVYGMNFDREISPFNMPELGWFYGYPFALLLMLASAGGLLLWFKRRGWL